MKAQVLFLAGRMTESPAVRQMLLVKSQIKGHERHTKDGKVVFVKPHSDRRTKKQKPQTQQKHDAGDWEDAVYRAIEEEGITRSDAQGIADLKQDLMDKLQADGVDPKEAAKQILAAAKTKDSSDA